MYKHDDFQVEMQWCFTAHLKDDEPTKIQFDANLTWNGMFSRGEVLNQLALYQWRMRLCEAAREAALYVPRGLILMVVRETGIYLTGQYQQLFCEPVEPSEWQFYSMDDEPFDPNQPHIGEAMMNETSSLVNVAKVLRNALFDEPQAQEPAPDDALDAGEMVETLAGLGLNVLVFDGEPFVHTPETLEEWLD